MEGVTLELCVGSIPHTLPHREQFLSEATDKTSHSFKITQKHYIFYATFSNFS